MSWGYFVDLNITLPSEAWKKISEQKLGGRKLKSGWSGFEDAALEKAFVRPFSEDATVAKVLKGKAYHGTETVHRIEAHGKDTSVRVCLLLDKSTLELAYPLVLAFQSAAELAAAHGSLQIVNDGTAPGENGALLSLAKRKIKRTKIDDSFAVTEQLMAELYGDLVSAPLKAKSSKPGRPISSKKS